jgi:putative hemolysin
MPTSADRSPERALEPAPPPRPDQRPELGGGATSLADVQLREGDYAVRLVRDAAELRAVQSVRFQVFNLELGEGLEGAERTQLDADRFDAQCSHLMLVHEPSGAVVGTYRLQTLETALAGEGFYCADEFAIENLPPELLAQAVELGRACVLREHRRGNALFALWRGIAAYTRTYHKRLLFGCCSLTSTDEREGHIADRWLRAHHKFHPSVTVEPRASHRCAPYEPSAEEVQAFRPPPLFGTYLRYGALACGAPAIDRAFGTIDFLVMLDCDTIDPRLRRLFFDD